MTTQRETVNEYARLMLRSAFLSLFASAIALRKRRGEAFNYNHLAKVLGKDKSVVSRWFASRPNWTLNTISDIAEVLDMDVEICARERSTGTIITPSGPALLPTITVYTSPNELQTKTETDASPIRSSGASLGTALVVGG